jgi:hypothetical protein
MALDVFISHSIGPEEIPVVNHLSAALNGAGVGAYLALYDRQPGVLLSAKVQTNIGGSDILVALVSKRGVDSEWVHHETGFALGRSKRVIAFVEKGIKPGGMLAGVEYYEFDPANPDGQVGEMATYVAWLKSQKELATTRQQLAAVQEGADRNLMIAEGVIMIGLIILLVWALSRN